jgi:hypothetical protein
MTSLEIILLLVLTALVGVPLAVLLYLIWHAKWGDGDG